MCGIAGLFDPADAGSGAPRPAGDRHGRRVGPPVEAAGDWVDPDGRLALAHRRLAVVDLTFQGSQPMISSDDRWVIVLNGEIDNHRDLAVRLSAEGVSFRGTSDTEVLSNTYSYQVHEQAKPLKIKTGPFPALIKLIASFVAEYTSSTSCPSICLNESQREQP